jgi:predicted nuclease with RNAse H fold
MRTAGVDLAAQDKNTAVCVVEWGSGGPRVELPRVGLDDDALLDVICDCDRAGIDAPFGWPQAFADAVAAHQARDRWPGSTAELRELAEQRASYRRGLSYRVTDLAIIDDPELSVRPLSVSTDRIGVTTFRCALLLDGLGHERRVKVDRSGRTGRVAEVYPAAALNAWGLPFKGYNGRAGREVRGELVEAVGRRLGSGFGGDARKICADTDHALDALVSALVARAVAVGATRQPDRRQSGAAKRQGWIHVPTDVIGALKRVP